MQLTWSKPFYEPSRAQLTLPPFLINQLQREGMGVTMMMMKNEKTTTKIKQQNIMTSQKVLQQENKSRPSRLTAWTMKWNLQFTKQSKWEI